MVAPVLAPGGLRECGDRSACGCAAARRGSGRAAHVAVGPSRCHAFWRTNSNCGSMRWRWPLAAPCGRSSWA